MIPWWLALLAWALTTAPVFVMGVKWGRIKAASGKQ